MTEELKMTKDKKTENISKIEDADLDKVSGGGFFSAYSVSRYNEAGVTVIGAGNLYNDGYILTASGENLTAQLANLAVKYYDLTGVPAWEVEEIRRAFKTTSEYRHEDDEYY